MVEFADYECGHCKEAAMLMPALLAEYPKGLTKGACARKAKGSTFVLRPRPERLGLTLGDKRLEGGECGHGWSGSSTGRKSPKPKLLECPRRMGPTTGVVKRNRTM